MSKRDVIDNLSLEQPSDTKEAFTTFFDQNNYVSMRMQESS